MQSQLASLEARFAQLEEARPALSQCAYLSQLEELYFEAQLSQLSLLAQLEEAQLVHIAQLEAAQARREG